MNTKQHADAVMKLSEEISPLLAGKPGEVQGAVLADLLAMWLAGHISIRDEKTTREMREELLNMHVEQVRKLIPVNEATILAKLAAHEKGTRQ